MAIEQDDVSQDDVVTDASAPISVAGQSTHAQVSGNTISFAGESGGRFVDLANGEYATPLRILPLGDSITFGISQTPRDNNDNSIGGYRDDLFNLLTDSGVLVDFVGGRSTGPDTLLDTDHQGTPGLRADMIRQDLVGQIGSFNPDVVLLMAGTNDLRQDPFNSGVTTPQDLLGIIEIVTNNNPNAQIFVSTLLPFETDGGRNDAAQGVRTQANQGIVDLVAQLNASGRTNIHLVDIGSLPLGFISDIPGDVGIHPTEAGYAEIARLWFEALGSVFGTGRGDLLGSGNTVDGSVQNIVGADGGDFLIGDGRANTIDGRGGNDLIDGGAGNDTISTGAGTDIVLASAGRDIITDLSANDRIELASGTFYIGEAGFGGVAGQVRSFRSSGQTIIETDRTGDGVADSVITLSNGEFVFEAETNFGAVQLQIAMSASPPPPPPPPPPPLAGIGDNLIVNGDFEDNGIVGDGFGFFSSLSSWVATSGQFEIQEGVNALSDFGVSGNGVLELASSSNAGIAQTVTVGTGQAGIYDLSFQYAERRDDPASAVVDVVVDGVVVATLNGQSAGRINDFNIEVELTEGAHTIGFVERGQNDGRGTLLDNVSLVFDRDIGTGLPDLSRRVDGEDHQPILLVRDIDALAEVDDGAFAFTSAGASLSDRDIGAESDAGDFAARIFTQSVSSDRGADSSAVEVALLWNDFETFFDQDDFFLL